MRLSPEIACQNLLTCLFYWTIPFATLFSPPFLLNSLKNKLSPEEAPSTPLCWPRSTRTTRDSCVLGKKKRAGLVLTTHSVFNHSPPHQAPAALQPSPGSRHRVQSAELQPHHTKGGFLKSSSTHFRVFKPIGIHKDRHTVVFHRAPICQIASKRHNSNFVCSIFPYHYREFKKKYCKENIFPLKQIYLQKLGKHEKGTVEPLKSVRVFLLTSMRLWIRF